MENKNLFIRDIKFYMENLRILFILLISIPHYYIYTISFVELAFSNN